MKNFWRAGMETHGERELNLPFLRQLLYWEQNHKPKTIPVEGVRIQTLGISIKILITEWFHNAEPIWTWV